MLMRGTRNLVPLLGLVLLLCVVATLYRRPQSYSDSLDYLSKFGAGRTKPSFTSPSQQQQDQIAADKPAFQAPPPPPQLLDETKGDAVKADEKIANPNPIPGNDALKVEVITTSSTSRGAPATKTETEESVATNKQNSVHFNAGQLHNADLTKPAYKEGDPVPDNYWTKAPKRIVKSKMKPDGTYWKILMQSYRGINPNVIPDPRYEDRYLLVAQQHQDTHENIVWHSEITCRAAFQADGDLNCVKEPMVVPIAMTHTDKCEGTEFPFIAMNIGPHDARLFNGPDRPFLMWGSQSKHVCFGQFMQDFRPLVDWVANYTYGSVPKTRDFDLATDLQRPPPYGQIEKNWFVFWDDRNNTYLHYHIYPRRVYAKLELDGSVGPDLAPAAYEHDDKCWAKHIELAPVQDVQADDHLHQATNSLLVTMCRKKTDPDCKARDDNTFIMTVFQHKISRYFHAMYDPYIMLFERKPPFKIHGMSKMPFWINGRKDHVTKPAHDVNVDAVKDQSEQFYITSFNWKGVGKMYHGYLDDDLLVAFGIEDYQAAGIDVEAGELIGDIFTC